MRTIIVDSNSFNTLDGFCDQIEKELIESNCPWGRNLDSLDEIARSAFNYTEDPKADVGKIVWLDIEKSRRKITETRGEVNVIDIIEDIFKSNPKIVFEAK